MRLGRNALKGVKPVLHGEKIAKIITRLEVIDPKRDEVQPAMSGPFHFPQDLPGLARFPAQDEHKRPRSADRFTELPAVGASRHHIARRYPACDTASFQGLAGAKGDGLVLGRIRN
jgi:hypothetical protein